MHFLQSVTAAALRFPARPVGVSAMLYRRMGSTAASTAASIEPYSPGRLAKQVAARHPTKHTLFVAKTVAEMRQARHELRQVQFQQQQQEGGSSPPATSHTTEVGFVPTMGCLHQGHLSLMRQAKKDSRAVVASIFVNPSQFAANEDFDKYPRQDKDDLAMCAKEGVDLVFLPEVAEMYHGSTGTDAFGKVGTFVEVRGKSQLLEGSVRPHFFLGVATVVSKLFNIVQPTTAFFGQKDVQQCVILRQMVHDLFMPLNIRVCPTVREKDGLAMSSRNVYLSPEERAIAPIMYRGMQAALNEHYLKRGERSAAALREVVRQVIATEPSVTIQYISIADGNSLQEVDTIDDKNGAILSGAIKVGKTRLIDNILLDFKM
ncbi:pantothenate synthetase [Capsaspora owczarzaki ATCC 30864]|uniref:Pantoate--beta-alanine ligase n=1 Tax=Capsaspora owczarzaki (strain ATCC 30864) TaxID=595528 RepID=A0A0D2X4P3_CAPO3|nr:pantothenate synthetase [Capsaspora owczarzaki ATCC 30864]KJE96409.1 pantothenate synthetase [Capsaspora owczarzaki ATCC 30864]|eukprot:XP_004344363.1 pantothenate synthetase [Capsaspora owczarzaki ATCC 30864]